MFDKVMMRTKWIKMVRSVKQVHLLTDEVQGVLIEADDFGRAWNDDLGPRRHWIPDFMSE